MMVTIEGQKGSIALFTVVILMTVGLLLIKSLHFFQERSHSELQKEIKYFEAFNKAESALAWGLTLQWDINTNNFRHWACQQEPTAKWQSCLKHDKGKNFVLSGKSSFRKGIDIKVYQWVILDVEKQQLFPRKHGWLDYCPVVKKGFCE